MSPKHSSTKRAARELTLQEREMHRYYQPWLDAHGSSVNVAAHVSDLAELDDLALKSLSTIGYRARQSRDKSLTAFAQLAALRLNVRRAMVSLIDSSHQYILAEATRTLSLVDDDRHKEHDELWLGSTVLDRTSAVCECAFKRTYSCLDNKGNPYSAKAAVIPDCREDPDYKDMPYVVKEPGIRFYAGVPIRSRTGHMIGVYAVSDEAPRAPLTYDELRFMQDIAIAVMDHLEWARDRVDRYKGERIVRGMADFIEGSPSMRRFREEINSGAGSTPGTASPSVATPTEEKSESAAKLTTSPRTSPRLNPQSPRRIPKDQTDRGQSPPPKRSGKADTLSRMLDRAARILRESTLAEGVVFFGPAGNAGRIKSSLRSAMTARERFSDREYTGTGTGTDDETSKRMSAAELGEGEASTDSDGSFTMRSSKILGISLTNNNDTTLFQNSALPVLTLENYFKLYPHGKSFHFSEQGSGLSSEDDSASESKRSGSGSEHDHRSEDVETAKVLSKKRKIKISHQELLKNLPGVRNVIFLPLWDYVEEKMVAGCFLWTSAMGRMMTLDDDLSYLRAFGNSIMSEVARMNALKDDRAKTTFIASMSHELRSPLHGILGSTEFLQDTAADSYQAGLINSISTCGKTLLDTLDHVLDYAKINKLGRARMKKNARSNRTAQAPTDSLESMNITADIDLAVVVEEVVEAVCAGHAFKKMHTGELAVHTPLNIARSAGVMNQTMDSAFGVNLKAGEVTVLLDISPRASWKVRTQPGALRRIIMNLLGNALKYTASGFVAISLRTQENANPNSTKIDAVFRVVDSGKGMSDDFQKNRLFVPFSQEDSFQPGTGLGLSIVRQIVDSLGGCIELKSVQDVGTEVDVHLSLTPAQEHAVEAIDQDLTEIAAKTRGLRLCLLDPNQEKEKPVHDNVARLDTTLREVCFGWFGMDVIKSDNITDTDADIFMYTEPPSVEYLLAHHGINSSKRSKSGKEVPLVIVCLNASEAIAVTGNHIKKLSQLGRIVEVIPQPCGPRKLANVLGHCIRRLEDAFHLPVKEIASTPSDPADASDLALRAGPIEDQGKATVLGVPSTILPHLNRRESKAEASRTREYLGDLSSEVPPSAAVTFPSADPTVNTQTAAGFKQVTAKQPSTIPKPAQTEAPNSDRFVPHVLLVDDNRINLQLLVMFMKKHKYTYSEATNGQEALDAYIASCTPISPPSTGPNRAFDFILMDISMPVMNGMEATRRIREFEVEHGLKRTTVIALTGLASAAAQREAETSGIDIYMPKPVKFQELRPVLESKREKERKKEEEREREREVKIEKEKERVRVREVEVEAEAEVKEREAEADRPPVERGDSGVAVLSLKTKEEGEAEGAGAEPQIEREPDSGAWGEVAQAEAEEERQENEQEQEGQEDAPDPTDTTTMTTMHRPSLDERKDSACATADTAEETC